MSELEKNTPVPVAPKPAPSESAEDARTQALADALRSSFAIVKVILIALVLVFLGSGFFVVEPQYKAVVLRFGKPTGGADGELLGPGFHWAFPAPIDEVVMIPVSQVQSINSTIGWYATTATQEATRTEPPPRDSLNPATEGYLLTADANIIHARGTLRYRIAEPGLRYEFGFVSASNLVQNAFNNALVYAAARYTVDDALTRDVTGFREQVRARFEQLAAAEGLGITVEQIDNMQVLPPRILAPAFAAVLEAGVKSGQALNDARKYEAETTNAAWSGAAMRVNAADNAGVRLTNSIAAEALRFRDNLVDYRGNPELFRRRFQADALGRVLGNAEYKWILPDPIDGGSRELLLQLSRDPEKPKTVEAKEHKD